MSITQKPFRCEDKNCPNTSFYTDLNKPSCPSCNTGNKVSTLCIIHLYTKKYVDNIPQMLCGSKKPIHYTTVEKVVNCRECLDLLNQTEAKLPDPEA